MNPAVDTPDSSSDSDYDYYSLELDSSDDDGDYDDDSPGSYSSIEYAPTPVSMNDSDTENLDDALMTFEQHTSRILFGSLNREQELAVTISPGGSIYAWNTQTGEQLFSLTDPWFSMFVGFSYDGLYLAIGSRVHKVLAYKINNGTERSRMFERVLESAIMGINWMCWYRFANILVIGGMDGNVYTVSMPLGVGKILYGTGISCSCGTLTKDDKKAYVAYVDWTLSLWDLETGNKLMQIDSTPDTHYKNINMVICNNDSNLYVSTDAYGSVVFCNNDGFVSKYTFFTYISSCAFSPSSELLAIGNLNGRIIMWNCELLEQCGISNFNEKIVAIIWIHHNVIAVSTARGNIIGMDVTTFTCKFKLYCHIGEIALFDYNPLTRIALTAGIDRKAKIWRLQQIDG